MFRHWTFKDYRGDAFFRILSIFVSMSSAARQGSPLSQGMYIGSFRLGCSQLVSPRCKLVWTSIFESFTLWVVLEKSGGREEQTTGSAVDVRWAVTAVPIRSCVDVWVSDVNLVIEHCPICSSVFVCLLGFKQAEQFGSSSPPYSRTFTPGRQRFHVRLRKGIWRYHTQPCDVRCCSCVYKPQLFHGGVPIVYPATTKSIRFPLSRLKRHCQDHGEV